MRKSELKKSNVERGFDWLILPQAYFDMALVGCDWLIETIRNEKYGASEKSTIHQSIQPLQYFVLPIVYNFKHGIELYLKGLLVDFRGEYDDKSHDLISLLNLLISKIIENSKSLDEKTKILKTLDSEVRKIIEKYYLGLYFGENRYKNYPDIQNEAERYPEAKSGHSYIPESFSCWVQISGEQRPSDGVDVESIKNEILELKEFLRNAVGKQISFKKI